MASPNFLIMNLLRLITPEEIGDIATKHNGGKFLSLTDLMNERVEHGISRDFSSPMMMEEIYEAENSQAKILPFKKADRTEEKVSEVSPAKDEVVSLTDVAQATLSESQSPTHTEYEEDHKDNENMSSFILIEKARLKRSQQTLKQKEIIELYQKNSHVDVEQIKSSNTNSAQAKEAGVLVNKKQY